VPEAPLIPDYTLLRPIGRGAYGEVWLARSVTGVHRAIKIVRRDRFEEDRPFEREFDGIRRFEPVSVGQESQVALLHVGRNNAAGFFYYVMELADDVETGEEIFPDRYVPKTLKELRSRRRRLPGADCLGIGLALTRALAHLHESGLVHRDIKPSNVIFVHGVPKLADIGLVSAMDASHSYVGTEGFVPPEGPGTAAADVYSLGKVLYEISTGRDRTEFPALPDDLDAISDRRALLEINEVIVKACDGDLKRRYPSAEAMREDLLLLQAGRSVRRLHVVERRLRFIAKYGVAATLISALAILSFVWASAQTRRANQNLWRAERAEAQALQRLHEVNFNWARANRLTGRPGQRFDSLKELAQGAARSNRLDLRNEAIACLVLPDLRPARTLAVPRLKDAFHLSPGLRLHATNDARGALVLRDIEDDAVVRALPGQGSPLTSAILTDDGALVATSDAAGRAWLWEPLATAPVALHELLGPSRAPGDSSSPDPGPGIEVRPLAFTPDRRGLIARVGADSLALLSIPSPDGRTPASGSNASVTAASAVRVERQLAGIAGARTFRLSPDGRLFATKAGPRIEIHSTRDGALVTTINPPEDASAMAWHPDSRRLALAWSRQIAIWDLATGRQGGLFVGHDAMVIGLAFDETGEWLASASWDRTTRLWQADNARELLSLPLSGNQLQFSPDGRRLSFRSWDAATTHVYALADTRVARRYSVAASRFNARTVFSPDGRSLLGINDGTGIHLFRPPLPAPLLSLPASGLTETAFAADGQSFYSGSERGLRRWPILWGPDGQSAQLGTREVVPQTSGRPTADFWISGDGSWLVARPGQGTLMGFPTDRPDPAIAAAPAVRSGSAVLHLNTEGTLACSFHEAHPRRLQIWNPRTGMLVTNLDSATPIRDAAFSPDRRHLAISTQAAITLLELDGWRTRQRLGRSEAVDDRNPIAFSPDGRTLAAAMANNEVWLIEALTGKTLAALPRDRLVTSLAFSPTGDALAVTCERGWFQLWNLPELRRQLARLHLDWSEPGSPDAGPRRSAP
jgi:WD40 repeat protein